MILNRNKFNLHFPLVMGICNLTKDSFSDGGKNYKTSDALKNIKKMFDFGASIIDIGAESTRPGSDPISYKKEIKKLEPILKKIPRNKFIISVDTNKIETQEFALQQGVHIINDIYGGTEDLFILSKKYKNGLVLMHTPGSPKKMQFMTNSYTNVVKDIKKIFLNKSKLLAKYNISQSKVWFGVVIPWIGKIPPPTEVVEAWATIFFFPGYWESWYLSTARVFAGFVIAMIIGIPFGLLLAINRYFRDIFFPPFEVLRPIPPLAFSRQFAPA